MSTVATLTYNQYLSLTFDVYDESYEGTYPNVYYNANVRFKFTGQFKIQATNIIKFGGLQTSIYRYDTSWQTDTGWYYLGHIREPIGCNRNRRFELSCSCQGWPNLNGTASWTSPTIEKPTYETYVKEINSTTITIYGRLKTNPYNLYTLRVWRNSFINNNLNGNFTESNLTGLTSYEYHIEPFMADLSGSYLDQTKLSVTTLENYKAITINWVEVTYTEIDNDYCYANCIVHTSDDSHVKKTSWDYDAMGGDFKSDNLTYKFKISNDTEYRMTVQTVDTLDRYSGVYYFYVRGLNSFKEVWVFDGNAWIKGKSMQLDSNKYKKIKLYYFNGTKWLGAKRY